MRYFKMQYVNSIGEEFTDVEPIDVIPEFIDQEEDGDDYMKRRGWFIDVTTSTDRTYVVYVDLHVLRNPTYQDDRGPKVYKAIQAYLLKQKLIAFIDE